MKQIEDERIRFYLEHRQQIEEWATVGTKDLPQFAYEFYASLRGDICKKVPDDAIVGDVSEPPGNSALFRLRRRNWPAEGPAVELGWWHKGRIDFSPKDYVWCGLYADQNSPYWQYFCDAGGRPETTGYPKKEKDYPMFRYLPLPEGNFWKDAQLEKYGQSVIQAVLKAWSDLAPLVDEAVASHNQ